MKAFPSSNEVKCGDSVTGGHAGMDLRDYFAAKAMQAILAEYGKSNWQTIAKYAYQIADSMLEARK